MKKIDNFTNCYDLSKTLKFRLIPEGKTLENFEAYQQLEKDLLLSENYKRIKELLDEYYKGYIEQSLNKVAFSETDLEQYAELYFSQSNEKDDVTDKLKHLKDIFYKAIKESFKFTKEDDPFSGAVIDKLKPDNDSDKTVVASFKTFRTYLTGFFQNRKNIITTEGNSTEVVFRVIDQNLSKYLNNIKIYKHNRECLNEILSDIDDRVKQLANFEQVFSAKAYGKFITQKGIDAYNAVIGGFTTSNGEKIKGLNEYINEKNQVSDHKIPKLNILYKQILSDREKISFLPEKFKDDNELLSAVDTYRTTIIDSAQEKIDEVFRNLSEYDFSNVYIDNKYVSTISERKYADWRTINGLISQDYDAHFSESERQKNKFKTDKEKYFKDKKVELIGNVERLICDDLKQYFSETWEVLSNNLKTTLSDYLSAEKPESLLRDKKFVSALKKYLDAVKEMQYFLKIFDCEENGATTFYTEIAESYENIKEFTFLYDKVRNYVTQKPYSDEKIKINFENSELLNGWDINKEESYNSVLLRRNGDYFLAILRKDCNRALRNLSETKTDKYYEKMIYKYLPSPSKMLPKVCFSASNRALFMPSERIEKIKKKKLFKNGEKFDINALHELIDFYKDCISKYDSWKGFKFKFAPTQSYEDISGFYKDVESAGYSVKFINVSAEYIDNLVNEGKMYLFRLYNKDFSKYSHGKKNLHTMYFTEIFSEENLKDPVFKLNGQAELFYRPASIPKGKPTHPKNQPIENKRPDNKKKTSVFEYDLIKDKRYTESQFFFHVPMTMNLTPKGNGKINYEVRKALKENDNNYVIGIDRGERNLLYVSVVDKNGKIVEQTSLNVIDGQDYYSLLNERAKSRENARREWREVENIKDLKAGYLSLAVNKICKLIEKYDAIVAMEDLNGGFKNTRSGIEKSVYQQFEKSLIDKLNFYVNKSVDKNDFGGLRKAYQLTEKFESFAKMGKQNGFIFYIPAWNTSKIDPVTGFVDLIQPKYKSVDEAKLLFSKFDNIKYRDGMFSFSFDYRNFQRTEADYKKTWTIYTYGDRIMTFRNEEKANSWDTKTVNITEEFKKLFAKFNIDYVNGDIKNEILEQSEKEFFKNLIWLLALTLQMRNSIPNSDVDYIISPVKGADGTFFDSRNAHEDLPLDADANGAYHIALKGLWAIQTIKNSDDIMKAKLSVTNEEWLKFKQAD